MKWEANVSLNCRIGDSTLISEIVLRDRMRKESALLLVLSFWLPVKFDGVLLDLELR